MKKLKRRTTVKTVVKEDKPIQTRPPIKPK